MFTTLLFMENKIDEIILLKTVLPKNTQIVFFSQTKKIPPDNLFKRGVISKILSIGFNKEMNPL
jgi:hypothetical protein